MSTRLAVGGALLLLLLGISGCAHSTPSRIPEVASAVEQPSDPESSAAEDPASGPDPLDLEDPLDDEEYTAGFPDPLERSNRVIFGFNNQVDRLLLEPATRVYRFFLPGSMRRAVRRFFLNLQTPVIVMNDLLQLEPRDAGVTLARFALNTFFLAGFLDAGGAAGLERHHADFGQTLAIYGVGSGPYLVLPLLGPSTARDGFGDVVDRLFDPLTYILGPFPLIFAGASDGFTLREQHAENMKLLREGSVDFYSSLRNVYYQTRIAEIWSRRPRPDEPAALGWDSGRAVADRFELVDLLAECCDEGVEAVSLDHRGVFGAPEGELAYGSIQVDIDDLPPAAVRP